MFFFKGHYFNIIRLLDFIIIYSLHLFKFINYYFLIFIHLDLNLIQLFFLNLIPINLLLLFTYLINFLYSNFPFIIQYFFALYIFIFLLTKTMINNTLFL